MKKTVNALGGLTRAMMCRFKGVREVIVFMQALSNEKEEFINKNGHILLTMKDNSKVKITLEDIYMYGNVDLEKEETINLIRNCKLVSTSNDEESWLPSEFDYETGTIGLTDGVPKGCPTENSVKWFKYNYCRIGKPEKVICYRINKRLIS